MFFLFVPTAFSYKKKLVVTLPRKPPLCLTVQTETAVIYYHCTLPCVNVIILTSVADPERFDTVPFRMPLFVVDADPDTNFIELAKHIF